MLEDTPTGSDNEPTAEAPPAKKTAARKAPAKKTAAKKTTTRATAAAKTAETAEPAETAAEPAPPAKKAAARKSAAKTTAAKKATTRSRTAKKTAVPEESPTEAPAQAQPEASATEPTPPAAPSAPVPLFQAPEATTPAPARKPRTKTAAGPAAPEADAADETPEGAPKVTTRTRTRAAAKPKPETTDTADTDTADQPAPDRGPATGDDEDGGEESGDGARRRRRRGGRRRRKPGGEGDDAQDSTQQGSGRAAKSDTAGDSRPDTDTDGGDDDDAEGDSSPSSRRRRRRRRAGDDGGGGDGGDDPQNTVTRVRKTRSAEDQITALAGSTRLEAKKQRRREGREAGRRRAPIVSEAEFLARRESVDRVMAIRQRDDLTQIAVLEDKVLVEHYVARESQTSLIGNVYLGRVQNVLPSMEAAFIDIGKGRNAVLYAGEVNWSALGHKDGQPRKIESVLSSGQTILVQVTKDPVGHKGARLTSQISLAGRFLVYVPDGTNSGISRKLPDTERGRLKALLKEIVPESAGVIVRTAAEGASEQELTSDVERLKARWEEIEKKSANKSAGAQLLYGEPDLMLKVVRDLFTEDFARLVIQGEEAWETVKDYVTQVAPDLEERLEKYDPSNADLFTAYRVDEQIQKGLDRKVWLPSGGSLVIDRTEAMTVVDVNTGKFTGSGGNLEETVTKNNLEAAEEMVRQLRLRDIGGIIVIDFIDMVLESNRDLVLRRLVECLGRDRTRHQVAEVTSLGLVQMTRKRIGTGLVESFSEPCEHCNGRGVVISDLPVEPKRDQEPKRGARRTRGGRGRGEESGQPETPAESGKLPSPKDVAAMARMPKPDDAEPTEVPAEETPTEETPAEETPAEASAEETPVEPTPEPISTPTPEPEPTPTPTSTSEQIPEPEPALEPAAPKVVTRTRRRSASRPAGPPVPTLPGVIGEPPVDGTVEPGTADTEVGSRPVVEHVPVKKRGARKR